MGEVKTYSDTSYIFSRAQDPQSPRIYATAKKTYTTNTQICTGWPKIIEATEFGFPRACI